MKILSPKLWLGAVAALSLGLSAQTAQATYSVNLQAFNQSNVLQNYAHIDFVASGNTLTLTLDATAPGDVDPGATFSSLGFNLATGTPALTSITTPAGWVVDYNKQQDGFGNFLQVANSPTNSNNDPTIRLSTVVVTLTFASTITTADIPTRFGANSKGNYFVAEYFPSAGATGFVASSITPPTPNDDEGVPIGVPAPAGLVLIASALPVVAFRRVFRRKVAVA